ncbi:MAG: DUF2269 family protein [Acidimicrobiia bacterium]|nr:DUF2269 family protein [Acidimicrobiia bacterium]
MSKVELYTLIHVLAAIIWVGGAATSQVVALRLKKADPGHRLGFAKDMRFVAQWLFIPSAVVAFVFGSLLVEETPAFGYDQTWLVIGNTGLLVALLIAAGYLVPHIRKAIRLMESGQGEAAGATMRRVTVGARLVVLILIVIVWAMVAKPGL